MFIIKKIINKTWKKVCRVEAWTFVCRETSFSLKNWLKTLFDHQTTNFRQINTGFAYYYSLVSHIRKIENYHFTNGLSCFYIKQLVMVSDASIVFCHAAFKTSSTRQDSWYARLYKINIAEKLQSRTLTFVPRDTSSSLTKN